MTKAHLEYFMEIWYIFLPFDFLVQIWYIFSRFGILNKDKSGNPRTSRTQDPWFKTLPVFYLSTHSSAEPQWLTKAILFDAEIKS
jgi:hypothetical protein